MSLLTAAEELAERLTYEPADDNGGPGFIAYTDPAEALSNRPCLLIAPPVLRGGTLSGAVEASWRVIALSSYEGGDLASLTELGDLIAYVDGAVEGIDEARPIRYRLTNNGTTIAAYELAVGGFMTHEYDQP